MEARSRRVGGGFPGYDGPALPRAMRSHRGRGGDAAKRQANNLARTGVFELLATVAGQILQDAGSEDPNKTKPSQWEASKDKPQSDLDSQITSLESVKDFTSVDKPQPTRKSAVNDVGHTNMSTVEDVSVQASNDLETMSCVVRTPSQEEERKTFVKDVSVDEGNGAVVHMNASSLEDQVMLPLSDSDMSTTLAGHNTASPSFEIKEMLPVPGTYGGRTEVEQCSVEKIYKSVVTEELVSETLEVSKQAALEIVEETPCNEMVVEAVVIVNDKSSDSDKDFCKQSEEFENKIQCSQSQDEAEVGSGLVQESPYQASKNSMNVIPEIRMQCKMSESGEYGESAELMEGTEATGDETANMDVEVKSVLVSGRNQPAAASSATFHVATPGLAEGQSTRPMVKRVTSRMDGKFYKREHVHRFSQRLHPETMTKKLESYSKTLKVRRAAKVAKRNHVAGTRTKRQHAEMESTDSGSSEDSRYGKKSFFSGIAAYTRQRTARGFPNKRKKTVDGSSKTAPDLHLNTSDLMELEYECVDGEPPAAAAKLRSAKAASVASSPTSRSAKLASKKSLEPHVKLSIKSFTVPELFVDLPESASVASLKRAVMDAAMNLLGGGLRVRVLMQGKKVPDEAATLSQIGISRNAKPESLGFMLEPSPVLTSASATAEDPLLVLSRAANQPAPRYPVYGVPGLSGVGDGGVRCPMKGRSNKSSGTVVDPDPSYVPPSVSSDQEGYVDGKRNGVTFSVTPEESVKGCSGMKSSKHMSERMAISPHPTRVAAAGALAAIRAQADASRRARNEVDSPSTAPHTSSHDSLVAGSGAIILHPGLGTGDNVPGMALVPMRNKISRALDNGKRRVRRPFSVTEVEALVHAVEKLGTGRWRDVKLRAFEQAKHRTYVDLKDKWKTLVHTARIAPHQRRGEPVPQDLLERVTRAHAYWTAHAAKQQADLDF